MSKIELTATQRQVLEHAADQGDGRIVWFPDNVKGGAQQKVLAGLFNRALISTNGKDWFLAAEGYDALGRPRPAPAPVTPEPDTQPATAAGTGAAAPTDATPPPVRAPRTRDNSKQASVIAMLRRPEGATVAQICAATGWQAHTVRGTFAGAFKKKLGLNMVSDKVEGGERIYRIA